MPTLNAYQWTTNLFEERGERGGIGASSELIKKTRMNILLWIVNRDHEDIQERKETIYIPCLVKLMKMIYSGV